MVIVLFYILFQLCKVHFHGEHSAFFGTKIAFVMELNPTVHGFKSYAKYFCCFFLVISFFNQCDDFLSKVYRISFPHILYQFLFILLIILSIC